MDIVELRKLINPLLRWWWLLVASVLLAAASAFMTVRNQPPLYSSHTTLVVGTALFDPNPSGTEFTLAGQLASTYVDIAQRSTVYEATREALGLSELPKYTVQQILDTQIIEITVHDTDPARAQAVAAELVNQLMRETPEGRAQSERQSFVEEQLDQLEASIAATDDEIARIKQDLETMFSASQIADANTQLTALEIKKLTLQTSYAEILTNSQRDATNILSLLEPANFPIRPEANSLLLYMLTAAMLGIAVAAVTAYGLTFLDGTVRSEADVIESGEVAILGQIPTQRKQLSEEEKLRLAVKGQSPVTDAYGALALSLGHAANGRPLNSLLISGPGVGENHSSVAAHLCVTLAYSGKKIVLIDGNLQRPALQRIFGLRNHTGLSTLLENVHADVEDFLRPTTVPGLSILPSGPLPPNSTHLLSSRRMSEVLAQLQNYAEMVVIDAPPLTVTVDGSILASQVDGVLMVVTSGQTKRKTIQSAIKILRQVGANLLGVVLTEVPYKQLPFVGRKNYNVSATLLSDMTSTAGGVAASTTSAHYVNGNPKAQPSTSGHQKGVYKPEPVDGSPNMTNGQDKSSQPSTKTG